MWPFLLSALGMTALALLFVLPTLLRSAPASTGAQAARSPRATRSAVLIALALPLGAAVVQLLHGWPLVPEPSPTITPANVEAMVQRLAERLKTQPDDIDGWRMLARSYEAQRRFDLAVDAHRQLARLSPRDAGVLVDQAVALGMSLDQRLSGEPEALLNQALALEPDHIQALALLGSAAFERADYVRAIALWQRIVRQLPPDDEMAVSITQSIDKAKALAAKASSGS